LDAAAADLGVTFVCHLASLFLLFNEVVVKWQQWESSLYALGR
jgi:hypothetical protein